VGRYVDPTTITYDSGGDLFSLADGSGQVLQFAGFGNGHAWAKRGSLLSRTTSSGALTQAVAWDADGRVTDTLQSLTTGGVTTTESYLTTYSSGRTASITQRRKVGTGSWSTVRVVEYEYYGASDANGTPGDLKRATIKDAAGSILDQTYYRYYTADTFDGATQIGYAGGLRYEVGSVAYARLKADLGGTDAAVDSASHSTVAGYADKAFKYDSAHRAVEETVSAAGCSACSAGFGTYSYTYTASGNADGFNSWKTKTVETLPDGNQITVYTNAYGQVMLKAYRDTASGQVWADYYRYDTAGRVLWHVNPSAFIAYDDPGTIADDATGDGNRYFDGFADLIDFDGDSPYLANAGGLIDRYEYYSTSDATASTAGGVAGYQKSTSIQRGELGTPIVQQGLQYFARTGGGATVYPVATETRFRYEDGSGSQTTSYAYTWYTASRVANAPHYAAIYRPGSRVSRMNPLNNLGENFTVINSSITWSHNSSVSSAARLDSRPYFVHPHTPSSGFRSGAYPGNFSVTTPG
jgi:hypothetical protein